MIRLLQTVSVLAVVVAVLGAFTIYGNGRGVDLAFADGHDGGGDHGGDCCDAPPDDSYSEPPPDDSYSEPPPDDYECVDCTFDQPPPGDYECVDCTFDQPPPGDYECVDCTFDQPPPGDYDCVDCTFDQPPSDGEYFTSAEGIEYFVPASGDFYFEPPTGEFTYEPSPGDFYDGGVDHDGGDYGDLPPDLGYEGTFFFDERGDFVFDGFSTFEAGPDAGDAGFFPDGNFYEFFDPSNFAPDLFVATFRPDEFAGDFGDFFLGEDFQPGDFDQLFNPDEFRPEEFGSFFDFDDFKPGDFGEFATVGDNYVDFGGHFDQFWGERDDEARAATDFFGEFNPGDFQDFDIGTLLDQVYDLDFQGFQELDKDVVFELFNDGLSGQEFDLRGDQWAGAFSRFDVEDILAFDHDFIAGAVHDFAPEDFLGIPDDQAFAMFQATFFDGPLPGAATKGGPEVGPPPPFNPIYFEDRLNEFEGQIGGFLGAMGPEHFGEIEDGQLVDLFARIDFSAPDFDRTILGGEDLGGIFASLEYESLAAMGQDQIMDAIGGLNAGDFRSWDPGAAYNVFENIDFELSKGMEHMGGLVGAMGPDQFQNIEGDKLLGLFDSFAFGGPEFDLATSGMDQDDIAAMIGAMDGQHLVELGDASIIGALQHLDGKAMGAWAGGTAFDIFSTIGLEQALGLDQLEGIVGNFAAEQIQQLGDDLSGLLGSLDFQNNGEVLRDFSFDTLSVLGPEDFQGLDVQQLVDLANTTGGDGILGLDSEQLQAIVENIRADSFQEFDPSVVGGMFAGLDYDQISGFDHEAMEAALEAVGANLLGGLGDFDGIAGTATAFDELANFADLGEALELDGSFAIQDGVFNFFGANLFGFN